MHGGLTGARQQACQCSECGGSANAPAAAFVLFCYCGQVNDLLKMKKYYRAKSSYSQIERKGISNRFGTAIGYGLEVKPRDTGQCLKWQVAMLNVEKIRLSARRQQASSD